MKRSRFSDEQIIGILKEHQAGMSAADLCRKYGVSDATFYKWRSKYGGMEVSEAKRLKALEEENAKLNKLLAESMMDVSTLREMLKKTSDARLQEESRELGYRTSRLLATTCLRAHGHRSARLPLPIYTTGRCKAAKAAEGAVVGTAAVRLSPPAPVTEARGRGGELEEALPPLQGGAAHGSQAWRPHASVGNKSAHWRCRRIRTRGGNSTSCRTRWWMVAAFAFCV